MKYKAKNFQSREDLEKEIVNKHSKTTDKKNDTITGTELECRKLHLSHGQVVWGVEVVVSDFTPPEIILNKIQRGPKFKSSINYTKDEKN